MPFFVPHCKKITVGQGKFYDGKFTAVNSKKGVNWKTGVKVQCLLIGNCDNFYLTIKFKNQMRVQIVWIFESDQIPNHNLSNKSNPNTDKPKDFWTRLNINKY